jgi:branched-chain amino acid aminotransferase
MPATPPQLCVLDGQLMPAAEATISVLDEGLLRGDGVFEGLRLTDGAVYALDEHLERMERSAQNMRLPLDAHAVRADVEQLAAAAPGASGIVRTIVTRGGRRITLLEPSPDPAGSVALASVPYAPTRVLDAVKSLSYGANMLARRIAREEGADDALLCTPHGRVLEGPTQSFFCVLDGVLVTPPLSDHVLDSITRRVVLAVSDAQERSFTVEEARGASEAFLSSSSRDVLPVHALDGRTLGDGSAPGPVSRQVAAAAAAHTAAGRPAPAVS